MCMLIRPTALYTTPPIFQFGSSGTARYRALTLIGIGCQTVVGWIEEKMLRSAFPFCSRVRRTINVQWKRDCGAFGPLGRMQNQQVACYQRDGVVQIPPSAPLHSF
jgi:hypothetical protein